MKRRKITDERMCKTILKIIESEKDICYGEERGSCAKERDDEIALNEEYCAEKWNAPINHMAPRKYQKAEMDGGKEMCQNATI